MFKEAFAEIFTLLDEVDKKLSMADEEEAEFLTQKIIQIRKQMDHFINYWLKFEEKINHLEEKYRLNLPDELFEGLTEDLLDNLENLQEKTKVNNNELNEINEISEISEISEVNEVNEVNEINEPGMNIIDESQMTKKINEDIFFTIEDMECISSFRKGLGYFDLSMMEEAAREFRKVVEKEPNFLVGHFYLGMAYSEMSLYDKALNEFRLILALIISR